ncbi:diacylglycerol kinase family protein [Nocardioides limicola]|uniref:diacylglycerol kinase family protein n=1 Tax=Nocardioides limicola TaxID=2803368 RepID=UPI0027DBAFF7|nr:diacylglycerol kinase family protein [Nocardioides sp. DJM-14]
MPDRSRSLPLAGALVCLTALTLVTALVVGGWAPLAGFDDTTELFRDAALRHDSVEPVLLVLEIALNSIALGILTVAIAALLWARSHPRAAIYTALVMVLTALVTSVMKATVGRERPAWQPEGTLLTEGSFPSGHASGITALAGVAIVLAWLFLRKRGLKVLVTALLLVPVLISVVDRLLLGRHYYTDVTAGILLGATVVLGVLAFYSPLPVSHAANADPLPVAPGTGRRLHVVVNPSKVDHLATFRSVVASIAKEAGWSEPLWHYTTVEDPGGGMAEAAAVAGADLVVVCGGDGTVREVCAELAGTGIPVGIVPAGTGNLLARNLDIPLFLQAAVDVAINGQDQAIDMVAVSGDGIEDTHFMVMAGMGFDAAIMEGVNEEIKNRVGWLAYVWSGLKSLLFPAIKVEVSIDGGEFTTHRARTVVVGNVGYLQAGMPLLPDAAIDDGTIDVVLLYPRRFLSWVPLALRILAKRSHTDDTINRMTGQSVVIRAAHDTPRQLDGDPIGPGRELRLDCIHGKLLVRVPR